MNNNDCSSKCLSGSKQICVQGTNDSSMLSKYSTSSLGYYHDPYISSFIAKPARRAPIIHWGYYIRFKAMNFITSQFCVWIRTFYGTGGQIIVLGAGYDSAYFRLNEAGLLNSIIYVEVDFPKVIAKKKELLQASLLNYSTLQFIGQDLRDTKSLHSKLLQIPNFDFNKPTLFISEVVLTYMNDNHSSRLIKWISFHFPNSNFLSYEQIFTHDSFGLVMLKHYNEIGSKLQSVLNYETSKSQEIRFCKLGFEHSRSIDMNTFYYNYIPNLSTEISRILSLEMFDEYEEWHLKCNHYTILLAGKGAGLEWINYIPAPSLTASQNYQNSDKKFQIEQIRESVQLTRYSHAACYSVMDNAVYVYGGYGLQNKVHCKLDSLIRIVLNLENSKFSYKVTQIPIIGSGPGKLIHHSLNILPDGRLILYGGRASPAKPNGDLFVILPSASSETAWKRVEVTGETPTPRWKHSANIDMMSSNIYLIIHGGVSTKGQVLNDTWRFDILASTWCKLNISSNNTDKIKVHSHSSVIWNKKLVIYGGLTPDLLPSNSLLALSYGEGEIGEWQKIVTEPSLPYRYSHSAVIHNSIMYVVGGIELHTPCYITLLVINLSKKTWIAHSLCHTHPNLVNFLPFHMTSLLIDQYECILTLGGGGNCFSFGTHINSFPFLISIN